VVPITESVMASAMNLSHGLPTRWWAMYVMALEALALMPLSGAPPCRETTRSV
jgi:hypothetical protein